MRTSSPGGDGDAAWRRRRRARGAGRPPGAGRGPEDGDRSLHDASTPASWSAPGSTPLLGDALEAVGYDTFLRDACRVIDAAKANDASRCAAIDASALEARCRATVAEVAGTPDACPGRPPSRPARGRDPRCLAVASRDPRLCAAVADPLGARHVRGHARAQRCGPARASGRARAKPRCARDAERWRGVLASTERPAVERTRAARRVPLAPREASTSSDADRTRAGGRSTSTSAPDLAQGLTLLQRRDGARLDARTSDRERASISSRRRRTCEPAWRSSSSSLAGAHGAELRSRAIERAELVVPGRPPVSQPGAQSTLAAKLDKLDARARERRRVVVDGDIERRGLELARARRGNDLRSRRRPRRATLRTRRSPGRERRRTAEMR